MPTLTRATLAAGVAAITGSSPDDVEHIARRAIDLIADALGNAEGVKPASFGTFTVALRAERPGRNPRTLVIHKIPARKVVKFIPGRRLEDKLASRSSGVQRLGT